MTLKFDFNRKFSFLLVWFFSLTGSICFGQAIFKEGYIKTLDDVNVYGYIGKRMGSKPQGIEFKEGNSEDVKIFTAREIKGYGLTAGTYYTAYSNSDTNKDDCVFLEFIVEGQLSLVGNNGLYFLKRANSKEFVFLEWSHGNYVKSLRKVMTNCPYIRYYAQFVGPDLVSVSKIVKEYNECTRENVVNKEGLPKQLIIGLVVGGDYTNATFSPKSSDLKYLTIKPLQDQSLVQGGATVSLRNHMWSSSLGVYTGLFYSNNRYSGTRKFLNNQSQEITEYSIHHSELKIPFGMEFRPPSKSKFSRFLRLGMTFPVVLNFESTSRRETETNGSVYIDKGTPLETLKKYPQISLGAGLDYAILNSRKVRVEFGWSVGNGTLTVQNNTPSNPGKFKSFTISGGLVF